MNPKSAETRMKLIRATIELLKSNDHEEVSIRKIARMAGVTAGLANYHFRTKEALVDEALRLFIGETIESGYADLSISGLPPAESLKAAMKGYATFLASFPGISRTAILRALARERRDDETAKGIALYMPMIREIDPDRTESARFLILQQLVAGIQICFLRAEELKHFTGIDFHDATSRDSLVETLISNLSY